MGFALRFPDATPGKRNVLLNNSTGFDKGYLSQARTVLAWAPDLQPAVSSGALPLNDAYATAQQRKRNGSTSYSREEVSGTAS
jgi:hypothetical protein